MNKPQTLMGQGLTTLTLAAASALQPAQCWAVAPAALPWDYTLNVVQSFLTGAAADFLIIAALISAGVLYAVGHDAGASRLAAAGITTYLALHALRLIGYALP